jgi:hypothetical protein
VERAARAEIGLLPEALRASTLAKAVIELARRLDDGPSDREASALTRELRLSLDALHRRGGDGPDETKEFLDGVGNAALGD